ncbi:MFS transporter [Nonomuraea dietziae]|uniref:Putative MFS family arabinose efflux permease n=1 Tax=Nonomuraea dietziae TaxID=65515 RepID=A0A7W5VBT6_9ACTN|nr:MFS transporter [Nonomuraea dietziae]MBB3733139.1 putative MFS family arabinose efflux permease [Nonomuraea dietziae]
MPRAVYVLAIGIFAMVTSEFAVGGLMPEMAHGLGVTISQIGYLITAFAVAMSAGGPLMTVALVRIRPKPALMVLFAIFLVGNVLAALAPSYPIMMVARVITGVASQAFFGVAISVAVQLSRPEVRGRALAVVLNGLMLGTLLGLPLSTLIGGQFGWRAAFWAVGALTVIAALATTMGVPGLGRADGGTGDFRQEVAVFRNSRLWLALSTSTLIIGATFAAFSYLSPILTQVTGFSSGTVPLLLVAYGAATVIGNHVVGRLADRHTISVLLAGLILNTIFLAGFALFAHLSVPAVIAMLGVGLVGVTMNPAMAVRVQRVGNAGPLVNTVHASFITLGVIVGSAVGGLAIDGFGLRAPLWLGVGLAVLGIGSLLPELARTRAQSPTENLMEERVEAPTH